MSTKKTNPRKSTHYNGGHISAGEKAVGLDESKTNRGQGQYADTASISDTAEKPVPRTQERGIGNSFAMAVDHVMNNAKNVKEQGLSFTIPNVATITPENLAKFGKNLQIEGFDQKQKLLKFPENEAFIRHHLEKSGRTIENPLNNIDVLNKKKDK